MGHGSSLLTTKDSAEGKKEFPSVRARGGEDKNHIATVSLDQAFLVHSWCTSVWCIGRSYWTGSGAMGLEGSHCMVWELGSGSGVNSLVQEVPQCFDVCPFCSRQDFLQQ